MIAVAPPFAAGHGIARGDLPQLALRALRSAAVSEGAQQNARFFVSPAARRLPAKGRNGHWAFRLVYPCIGCVFGRIGVVYECFVFLPKFLRGSRWFNIYHGVFSIDCKKYHQVWKWAGWRGHHKIFTRCFSGFYSAACGVRDWHCYLNNRQMVARGGQAFRRASGHYGASFWRAFYGRRISCEPRLGGGAGTT